MIHTTQLANGITLRCCRDLRFKQGCLSLQFVRLMREEEAARNALLPAVLLRGTRKHPDLQSISRHLEELYGADIHPLVRRVGDYQTTGFSLGLMDDRFALPGDQILASAIAFLEEILLEPLTEEDSFLPEFVEGEKKNLVNTIESMLSDRSSYALYRLIRNMCREDSYRIPRLGELETVAGIDHRSLYEHYRKVLRESPMEIFYVGSARPEEVARLLMPLPDKLERSYLPLPPQTSLTPCPGSDETETMDIAQGKLCMGFTTPITGNSPQFPAMMALNILFGSGMTSKLFMNVREKMSLCYSIHSGYTAAKGLLSVSAGIDFDKEALTRREVLRQLELCKQGRITDEELNAAREAILHSLRATLDSAGAIEGYHSGQVLSGSSLTLEEYRKAVENLTLEEVVAAANTVQLHSTFFLKGGCQ